MSCSFFAGLLAIVYYISMELLAKWLLLAPSKNLIYRLKTTNCKRIPGTLQ
jgi:hypothetical protein